MQTLFLSVIVSSSMLTGIYTDIDRGALYKVDKNQLVITQPVNNKALPIKAIVNKKILLRRIYEN